MQVVTRFLALQISGETKFKTVRDLEKVPEKYLTYEQGFIELTCIANGFRSPNSKYSRTEFREIDKDGKKAYWDSDSVTSKSMYGQISVEKLPIVKKSIMFSQIKLKTHGAPLMMFLRDKTVYMVCNTKSFKKRQEIDTEYNLGDIISFNYTVSNGVVYVVYRRNCESTVRISYSVDFKDSYFKVGNYMQSASPPEEPDATSVVRIYNLNLQ